MSDNLDWFDERKKDNVKIAIGWLLFLLTLFLVSYGIGVLVGSLYLGGYMLSKSLGTTTGDTKQRLFIMSLGFMLLSYVNFIHNANVQSFEKNVACLSA